MQCAEFAEGSRAPGARARRGDRRRPRRIAASTAEFAPPQGSRQTGPRRVRGITQTGEVADADRHQAGTGAGHAHRWEVPLRGLQSPRPYPPCSGASTTGPHNACHHRGGPGTSTATRFTTWGTSSEKPPVDPRRQREKSLGAPDGLTSSECSPRTRRHPSALRLLPARSASFHRPS